MASKKTEKKPFPEELRKRTAAKKAAKVEEVQKENTQVEEVAPKAESVTINDVKVTETEEMVNVEVNAQINNSIESVETTISLDEAPVKADGEEVIDESGPSEEFTIEGNDVESDASAVVLGDEEESHDKEEELLPPEGVDYDPADPAQGPQPPILSEIEKIVNGEKPVEEKKPEKPELPKQRNYYNDRFASTWGGVQYDY